ncbi:MAG TPA: hypothetical protein VG518_05890 [Solirubrobacterales bacterium]|nr:hypothetical protein [Solirubrobacterales bacterium]
MARLCGALLALSGLMFLLTSGIASASTEVSTYVGCDSLAATPVPSHECEIGNSPGGYLEANENLEYDICTKHPSGETVCEEHQNATASILFGNVIPAKEVGQYQVVWSRTGVGTELGSWTFTMRAAGSPPETSPESPGGSTPPPAAMPAPPSGPSAKCLAAKGRAKALAKKLKNAGKKQKPKLRAKLRKARAGVGSACSG